MSEPHLTPSDAEQYILGALDPELERKLEAHTLVCDACARLLQQEAMLEEQLREVASTAPREDNVIRPARWQVRRMAALVVGPALAAAAALALVVAQPRQVSRPAPTGPTSLVLELPAELPSAVVACPDLTTQESCAEAAAARGLLVQYPLGMGEVPRYEGSLGISSGALPSRPASL
ncbi:anti-sigma factor [Hyalangium gracile]|uniref:zf-HC2 domain-containing protein n=1 Tax=Hyalangium gracile TaxID=394092 RepID=UPI001CCDACD7|nr:zf-HC2 domain-containing protein [Hyalangium gracile]